MATGDWVVSSYLDTTGGKNPQTDNWFSNSDNTAITVPTSGWQYRYGNGSLSKDPTLTITEGGLANMCRQYSVSASGLAAEKFSTFLGEFSFSNDWSYGRPVYDSKDGRRMYVRYSGRWYIHNSTTGEYLLENSLSHIFKKLSSSGP